MRTLITTLVLAGTVCGSGVAAADDFSHRSPPVTPLTQQDPRYRAALEHIAQARQLLDKAIEQVESSKQAFALPGFDYDLLKRDLESAAAGIDPLLLPDKRRLRYQTLVPDGAYFHAVPDLTEDHDDR